MVLNIQAQTRALERVRVKLREHGKTPEAVCQKRGEPNLVCLPVSRHREVVCVTGTYDLWGAVLPLAFDLTLDQLMDHL